MRSSEGLKQGLVAKVDCLGVIFSSYLSVASFCPVCTENRYVVCPKSLKINQSEWLKAKAVLLNLNARGGYDCGSTIEYAGLTICECINCFGGAEVIKLVVLVKTFRYTWLLVLDFGQIFGNVPHQSVIIMRKGDQIPSIIRSNKRHYAVI